MWQVYAGSSRNIAMPDLRVVARVVTSVDVNLRQQLVSVIGHLPLLEVEGLPFSSADRRCWILCRHGGEHHGIKINW